MSDWTAGYVAEVGYTYGYYPELNPLRVKLALLNQGLQCPNISTACELGFGQGMSIAFHATASSVDWYGTDFNPAQASQARDLAEFSGTSKNLHDDAFEDFIHRKDLPDFDYIGLHGIWSWISDGNRKSVVDFIKQKLKVGGVLYLGYNTQPGWATFAPIRHIISQHANVMGSKGAGIVERVDNSLAFAEEIFAASPGFSAENPGVVERLAGLKKMSKQYLAHEYFNRDWAPMHFSTMVDWLEPAKLQYGCSATLLEQVDALNLTPDQQKFLSRIADIGLRETARDFIVNQGFRRDYWIKGRRKMSMVDQVEALRGVRVILVENSAGIELKVATRLGDANLQGRIYAPVIDILSDHKIHAIGQLERVLLEKGITFAQLVQVVVVLAGKGCLFEAQDEAEITKKRKLTDKLNTYIVNRARSSSDMVFLASPVTGGGVQVTRMQQLFIAAMARGAKTAGEWAASAWQSLQVGNEALVKNGEVLKTAEENKEELLNQANEFLLKKIPILKGLMVI